MGVTWLVSASRTREWREVGRGARERAGSAGLLELTGEVCERRRFSMEGDDLLVAPSEAELLRSSSRLGVRTRAAAGVRSGDGSTPMEAWPVTASL